MEAGFSVQPCFLCLAGPMSPPCVLSRPFERQYGPIAVSALTGHLAVVGCDRRLDWDFGYVGFDSPKTELPAASHNLARVCNPLVAIAKRDLLALHFIVSQLAGLG